MANIWHDISTGKKCPEIVNVITEITRGTRTKYELDKETGLICLDRVLYTPMYYPTNYGFIPRTYCGDGDPLDMLILSQVDILPGVLVSVRVIGVMQMIDNGETDDKIIGVVEKDNSTNHLNDLADLPENFIKELRVFFEDYKKLENKPVEITGFFGKARAIEIIEQSIVDYNVSFGDKVNV